MTCPISQQIAQHVNEPQTLYCQDECNGELTIMIKDNNEESYTCDTCGALHFLDERGLELCQ